jgi:hypothetical protein
VLRFWAEVLAGYTAVTRSAPTRVGPIWLHHAIVDHVPTTFELTPAQRAGLAPAVTAWATWAAGEQGLPGSVVAQLAQRISDIDASLDAVYADPDLAPIRCYLSDVASCTADGEDLIRAVQLRTLAVPLPHQRPESMRGLLAADPAQRRQILAEYVKAWGPPDDDYTDEEWVDALSLVADQLWYDDPPEVGRCVLRYLDSEPPEDADVLGDLAKHAIKYASDRAGYLAAVEATLAL